MTGLPREPDRSSSNEADAADFLGGQPDEVALFALARRPRTYIPLTDAEISLLKAAVAGTLAIGLSDSVRKLLTDNAAATEFVMSEQLLANANRKPPLPARLSDRVLRSTQSAKGMAPSRRWQIPSWRFAGMATAAAGLVLTVSIYGLNRSESPNFTVATLDNYEILADSGTVTRGGKAANEAGKAQPALNFIETEVERLKLMAIFDKDQRGKSGVETIILSQLSTAIRRSADRPHFVFDAAIGPDLVTEKDEAIALRIYDLSDPANRALATSLHLSDVHGQYFVSLAP
jgi:hypothetical protein